MSTPNACAIALDWPHSTSDPGDASTSRGLASIGGADVTILRPCSDCGEREIRARGFCARCYASRRKQGALDGGGDSGASDAPNCRWDGCDQPQDKDRIGRRKGYCVKHFSHNVSRARLGITCAEFEAMDADCRVTHDGYVLVRVDGVLVAQHRVVMETKLGRPLRRGESVHHVNGVRDDNRPENLELWVGPIRYGQRATDIVCHHCGSPYLADEGVARRAAQTAGGHIDHPRNGDDAA